MGGVKWRCSVMMSEYFPVATIPELGGDVRATSPLGLPPLRA